MPLLSEEELKIMCEKSNEICMDCKRYVHENYCRTCDEGFESNHDLSCPTMKKDGGYTNNHLGHKTY